MEASLTLCAIKRLLATVIQHMCFKIGGYSALVAALVAIGGLFSVILELLGKFCQFYCLRLSTAFSRCQWYQHFVHSCWQLPPDMCMTSSNKMHHSHPKNIIQVSTTSLVWSDEEWGIFSEVLTNMGSSMTISKERPILINNQVLADPPLSQHHQRRIWWPTRCHICSLFSFYILVDCLTQLISIWIFICCVPWQS